MRAYEFIKPLLEYRQDLTIKQFGPQLLSQIKQYSHPDYKWLVSPMQHSNFYDPQTGQWDDQRLLKAMFRHFEDGDPTYNSVENKGGLYVPWIAREYSKGNIKRIEDVESRVKDLLTKYHNLKQRNKVGEYKDIMKLSFNDLPKIVNKLIQTNAEIFAGKYTKLLDDNSAIVVIPHDLTASKYWSMYGGKDTEWCTRYPNNFERYTKEGPLYIIIPKDSIEFGIKFQLHIPSDQFMDENDEPASIVNLFNQFPSVKEVIMRKEPRLKDSLIFLDKKDFSRMWQILGDIALGYSEQIINEDMKSDDGYLKYLLDEEYIDQEEYDILKSDPNNRLWKSLQDSDYNYASYNYNVESMWNSIEDITTLHDSEYFFEKHIIEKEKQFMPVTDLNEIFGDILYQELPYGYESINYGRINKEMRDNFYTDVNISYYNNDYVGNLNIASNVSIRRVGDYVIRSNKSFT